MVCCFHVATAMPLDAATREERERASRRQNVRLEADRVIHQRTRSNRDILLEQFDCWLRERGSCFSELVEGPNVDPEFVSNVLVEYGKDLYYSGKPYGRYAETINGVAARRVVLRKQLVSAWDLAFSWISDEPHSHHPAMPVSILLSICTFVGVADRVCYFCYELVWTLPDWRGFSGPAL